MTGSPGEMPFLDHLEELRSRILRALAAIVIGFAVGLWAVQQFQLVTVLKAPIAPYLTDGKLIVTSPTEPVMIVFKLGFLVGLVLASPVILWQLWAFLAPALYEREKRALVPSLFVGLILFLTGAAVAYHFVVPQALRVLFSFQSEAISPFITYDAWFSFVLQIVLALGISFELPLVMIILSWLGVIGPGELHRFRRYAVVCSFIAGAVLSPGADLLSMLMMTVPLALPLRGGRGRVGDRPPQAEGGGGAALVLLGLGAAATPAGAQDSVRTRADRSRGLGARGAGRPTGIRGRGRARRGAAASRPVARQHHRQTSRPPDRTDAELPAGRFGREGAHEPPGLSPDPLHGRLGDGVRGGSGGAPPRRGADRAAGRHAGGGFDRLPAEQLHSRRLG